MSSEEGMHKWRMWVKKVGTNGNYARNPNSNEKDILHGADVDVNTFTFNSVTMFCLQRIDVVHLIQLRDENEPFKN